MNLPWLNPVLAGLLKDRDRLAHAILITGPPAIGKSLLADRFANALLCESPGPLGHACGHCEACLWFAQGNHPDLRRLAPIDEEAAEKAAEKGGKAVKASREIRIEQVRALAELLAVTSHRSGRRIVLIDPADALNAVAANGLLKTLEEPGQATHFMLVTHRPDVLPATIRSRCVRVTVAGPPTALASQWLQSAASVDAAQAQQWLAAAGGAPLLALRFAEPAHAAAHRLILDALGGLPDTSVLSVADTLHGLGPATWLTVLQAWVADLARVVTRSQPDRFPARAERLRALSARTNLERVTTLATWLGTQRAVVEHPMNPRLFCESALFRYAGIFAKG